MNAPRIAQLLDPFLGPVDRRPKVQDLLHHISTYIDLLQRWNARVNLTAVRNEEEIVTRHFGESLFAARHLFPGEHREGYGLSRVNPLENGRTSAPKGYFGIQEQKTSLVPAVANDHRPPTNDVVKVADIGSGAGFPGIPIRLWVPEISLTLIESNHKKVTFLREVIRALTLTNVNIQTARAETPTGSSFDVVTLRAVERFESILPVAASLVAPAGRLALLIGQSQLSQALSALRAFNSSDPIRLPHSRSRVLVIAIKALNPEPT
jgi:16S rRNA (guanine527-N7)-methyltransferase